MRSIYFLLILSLAVGVPAGFSENPGPVSQHPSGASEEPPPPSAFEVYLSRCDEKLEFGTANFMLGWSAVIAESVDQYRQHQNEPAKKRITPLIMGFGKGLLYAALDSAGGVLNMVTAPVPQFTVPLPKDGIDVARVTCSTVRPKASQSSSPTAHHPSHS